MCLLCIYLEMKIFIIELNTGAFWELLKSRRNTYRWIRPKSPAAQGKTLAFITPDFFYFFFVKRGLKRSRIGYVQRNQLQSSVAETLGARPLKPLAILKLEEEYECRA